MKAARFFLTIFCFWPRTDLMRCPLRVRYCALSGSDAGVEFRPPLTHQRHGQLKILAAQTPYFAGHKSLM